MKKIILSCFLGIMLMFTGIFFGCTLTQYYFDYENINTNVAYNSELSLGDWYFIKKEGKEETKIYITEDMVVSCDGTDTLGNKKLVLNYEENEIVVDFSVKYRIDFKVEDEIYETQYVLTPDEIVFPEVPEIEGYAFAKWAQLTPQTLTDNFTFDAELTVLATGMPKLLSSYSAIYEDTLAQIPLPFNENGNWVFKDSLSTKVGDVGVNTFIAKFIPTDTNLVSVEEEVIVNVSKKTLNFSNVIKEFSYDGTAKVPTFELPVVGLRTNYEEYYIGDAVNVGEYEFDIEIIDRNYQGLYSGIMKINPVKATINIDSFEIDFDEEYPSNFAYTVKNESGEPMEANLEELMDISLVKPVYQHAGTYEIDATVANTNFITTINVGYLTVNKVEHDLTDTEIIFTTGGNNITYGDPLSSIRFAETDVRGTWGWENPDFVVLDTAPFETTAVFTPNELQDYLPSTRKVTLTVVKRVLTINITKNEYTYDGNEHTIEYTLSNVVAKDEGDVTIVGNITKTNADTYAASLSVESSDLRYVALTHTSLIINKASSSDFTTVYTKQWNRALTLSDIEIDSHYVWVNPDTHVTELGEQKYFATYTPDDTENYEVETEELTINIIKATASVTALENYAFTYKAVGYELNNVTRSHTESSLEYSYVYTAKDADPVSVTKIDNAGVYAVTITLPESVHYNEAKTTTIVTINQVENKDSIVAIQKSEYGFTLSKYPLPTNTFGTWGWQAQEGTPETASTPVGNAGTVVRKAVFTPSAEYAVNYASRTVEVTFNIAKKPTNKPSIAAKTYEGKALVADVKESDLYKVDKNDGGIAAGDYDVVISLVDPSNYRWAGEKDDVSTITLNFKITITDANKWNTEPTVSESFVYEQGTFTYTVGAPKYPVLEEGAEDNRVQVTIEKQKEDGTWEVFTGTPENIGAYRITFTVEQTESYNGLTYGPIYCTISPLEISVPSITTVFTWDGNEKPQNLDANNGKYSVVDTGKDKTDVGEYTVTLTLLNNNYEWSDGTTEVKVLSYKIEKTINTWISQPTINDETFVYGEETFEYTKGTPKYPVLEEGEQDNRVQVTIEKLKTDGSWETYEELPENIGTYRITFAVTGTDNYTGLSVIKTFTITQGNDPDLDFESVGCTRVWSAGLKLSDITIADSRYAWTNGNIEITNVGEQKFSAIYTPTNSNYKTVQGEISVNVTKATATVTANATYTFTYNPDTTLETRYAITNVTTSHTETAALTYTYKYKESATSEETTVEGLDNAGIYTVTITLGESTHYLSASTTIVVTIEKITNTDSIKETITTTYGTALSTYTLPTTSSTIGTWSWAKEDGTKEEENATVGNAGTLVRKAIFTPHEEYAVNYASRTVNVTFTIAKKSVNKPTIEVKTYTGSTLTADVKESSLYTVTQNNGGIIAGEYDVVLSLTDANNYYWAGENTNTSTITLKFKITINEANIWTTDPTASGNFTYENGTFTYTVGTPKYPALEEGKEDNRVQVVIEKQKADGSWEVFTGTPENIGTYRITFTIAETESYNGLTYGPIYCTISPLEIPVPSITTVFTWDGNEKPQNLDANNGKYSVVDTGKGKTDVGEYTVTLTLLNNNYEWSDGTTEVKVLSYKIEQATNTWTEPTINETFVYGKDTFAYTIGTPKYPVLEEGEEDNRVQVVIEKQKEDSTWEVFTGTPENVGEYRITFTVTGTGNYTGLSATKDFTITQGDDPELNFESAACTKVWNPGLKLSDITISDSRYAWTNGNIEITNVGEQKFSAIYTPTNSNYKTVQGEISVNVTKATATVTANATYTFTYNPDTTSETRYAITNVTTSHTETATLTYTYKYKESATSEETTVEGLNNAGIYTVTITLGESAHYLSATTTTTVTINQIENTDSIVTTQKAEYGETLTKYSLPTNAFGTWGWQAQDGTPETASTPVGNAGTVVRKAVFTPSAEYAVNYASRTVEVTFNIAKKEVEEPKEIASKVYSGETLTADIEIENQPYTVTENAGGINVGNYDVVFTLNDPSNYCWKKNENKTKAEITLTFKITKSETNGWKVDKEPKVCDSFVYSMGMFRCYEGEPLFSGIDNQVAVSFKLKGTDTFVPYPDAAGDYVVTFSVAETDNYVGTTFTAEFSIFPLPVVVPTIEDIVWDVTPQKPVIDTSYYNFSEGSKYLDKDFLGEENVGTYTFDVTLYGPNYVWEGDARAVGATKTITYNIVKATDNNWVIGEEPSITGWTYTSQGGTPGTATSKYGTPIIEYKLLSAPDTAYSTTLPVNAGTYVARFTVPASDKGNYNGIEGENATEIEFIIAKASSNLVAPVYDLSVVHYENTITDKNISTIYSRAPEVGATVLAEGGGTYTYQRPVFVGASTANQDWEEVTFNVTFTPNSSNFATETVTTKIRLYKVAHIGNTYYGSIENAVQKATSGKTVTVIPNTTGNVTIANPITINSGVTLTLPYRNAAGNEAVNSNSKATTRTTLSDGYTSIPDTYSYAFATATLTNKVVVKTGVVITNNGTITIAGELGMMDHAQQGGKPPEEYGKVFGNHAGFTGQTARYYAKFVLEMGAQIVNNSGSKVNCYGYIDEVENDSTKLVDEEGNYIGAQVIVNNGASLYMPFIISDFNGGTYIKGCVDDKNKLSPFNRYEIRNVLPRMTIKYGGNIYGWINMYFPSVSQTVNSTINIVGTTETFFFQVANGVNNYIVMKHEIRDAKRSVDKEDWVHGVTKLDFYGGGQVNSIKISAKVMFVIDYSVDTSKLALPIPYSINIGVHSGNYYFKNIVKMLPGSEIFVDRDAEVRVDNLTVTSSAWTDSITFTTDGLLKVPYNKYLKNLPVAKLVVNGKLTATALGGTVTTTSNSNRAEITVTTPSYKIYEPAEGGKVKSGFVSTMSVTKYHEDGGSMQLVYQNADGTTKTPVPITAGGTYNSSTGDWTAGALPQN